ncbi:MAG: ABC transporter ATP-binding protein [bacterium]
MLNVENLRVSYGEIAALHGVSFHIDEGEIVCIIGANGAGKSTILKAISRLVTPIEGAKITYKRVNLLRYPADKIVSTFGISHVPEGRRLFGNLTVMENLRLASFARKDTMGIKQDLERIFTIFPRLKEREAQKALTLSGGEQQMLAIGRAFMSGRQIMLLDEPSMGLAPLLMMSVFEALKEINTKEGTAILLVEQNARLALRLSQRGYVLENGHMVLEGGSTELLQNPQVQNAYLGG